MYKDIVHYTINIYYTTNQIQDPLINKLIGLNGFVVLLVLHVTPLIY